MERTCLDFGGNNCQGKKTLMLLRHSKNFHIIPILFRYAGQVGYLIAGMKEVTEAQIGDTLYSHKEPVEPLPGFKLAKPMVFAGEQHTDSKTGNSFVFPAKVKELLGQ